MAQLITHIELLERLLYDPLIGIFVYRKKLHGKYANNYNGKFAGKKAGYVTEKGYYVINLSGRYYSCSRLVWFYITGSWPPSLIDHINGNRADNRFENLRLATPSQNSQNRKIASRNTSGVTGVSFNPKYTNWHARIMVQSRSIHLGFFDTFEQAAAVRKTAEAHYFAEFMRTDA